MKIDTNIACTLLEKLAQSHVGRFYCPGELCTTSQTSVEARSLPILAARFPKAPNAATVDNVHIGWGTLQLPSNAWALTFRMQVAQTMHLWFANASDASVWKILDSWANKGRIAMASTFPDGKTHLAIRDYNIHPELNKLRHLTRVHDEHLPAFIGGFARLAIEDSFQQVTSSDLPRFPTLKSVHARIISSEQTDAAEEIWRIRRDLLQVPLTGNT